MTRQPALRVLWRDHTVRVRDSSDWTEHQMEIRVEDSKVTPKAFARLANMSPDAVYKAVQDGRLGNAVVRQGRRVFIDPLRGLEALGRVPDGGDSSSDDDEPVHVTKEMVEAYDGTPLEKSLAIEKFWKAKRAELDYRKATGDLIEIREVAERYVDEVTACRTKLLAIPSRAKQRLGLNGDQHALLESLVREALEELGRESS